MRLLLQCAALCCAFFAVAAQARPFTVDDLLRIDRRAEVGVSPDGRWLVLSITQGQAKAPRFDNDVFYPLAAGRLFKVDLARPGPATPLLVQDQDGGYTPGPFSPDGRRILVNRLRDHQWEMGVVDLASGAVRWLGVGMDYPLYGRSAQWRSNHEIVAITTPPDQPDALFLRALRSSFTAKARAVTATTGGPSVLSIGSGRFLSRGPDSAPKTLTRIDVDTGQVTRLAEGDFTDLEISRTGRYVAAYQEAEDVQPRPGDAVRGGTVARRRTLLVADLATGKIHTASKDSFVSAFLLAWAPSDDRLLVYSRRVGQAVDQGRLVVVTPSAQGLDWTPQEGVRPTLSYAHWGFEYAQAGWVGDTPAVFGRSRDNADAPAGWLRITAHGAAPLLQSSASRADRIVATTKGEMLAVGGGRGFRIRGDRVATLDDVTFEADRQLGDTGRPLLNKITLGDALLVRRKSHLVRLSPRTEIDLGAIPEQAVLLSGSGAMVTANRDAHGVETIAVVKGGLVTPVMTLNSQLAVIDFGDIRPITHKGPRGEALTSWVILPPGWTADQRPPLVVFPYPGRTFSPSAPPENARNGSGLWDVSAQVLAARGYAVLYPSLPRDRYPDDPSRDLASEILNVVDAVGAAGLADTSRIGMWGHSFGGHAVLAAAAQSKRFGAIIDTAGISDLVSGWGSYLIQADPSEGLFLLSRAAYFETGQMRVGGPPWSVPGRYIANSPIFHADKITAPVLLAYGDLDAYSDKQGGEMFAALYRQGKDARFLTYFGEGHVITAPGNVRHLYGEALGWLDSALMGVQATQPSPP